MLSPRAQTYGSGGVHGNHIAAADDNTDNALNDMLDYTNSVDLDNENTLTEGRKDGIGGGRGGGGLQGNRDMFDNGYRKFTEERRQGQDNMGSSSTIGDLDGISFGEEEA